MTAPFPSGLTAPMDWYNGIMPMLPGGSIDWVKNEILIKLRTFFQISGCWRDWIGPITLDPTTAYYSAELTDYKAGLVNILAGYRMSDQFPILPVLDSNIAVAQTIRDSGRSMPQWFFRTPEGLIAIFPVVPEGVFEQVMLHVSMMPIDLCVPEWIKLRHFDAIRAGVLGAAYLMPGVNYKPDLGARMEKRFHAAMSRATLNALASGTTGQLTAPMVPITHGSQRGRFATVGIRGTRW
jgi:hypothetical protein